MFADHTIGESLPWCLHSPVTISGIGLPFIALLFWFSLGSLRLLLVPALALGFSYVIACFLGFALTFATDIPGFQPNIGLFLCLALSIDYSFFLVTGTIVVFISVFVGRLKLACF